ncbi:MAG: hypothetical protein D6690_17910 [Nitrospirae bacterium]|nr:MAG: hypothetical protein D6690_17910 [Nitrospirota bacterium]
MDAKTKAAIYDQDLKVSRSLSGVQHIKFIQSNIPSGGISFWSLRGKPLQGISRASANLDCITKRRGLNN